MARSWWYAEDGTDVDASGTAAASLEIVEARNRVPTIQSGPEGVCEGRSTRGIISA
jgi:hypothetical protein